MVTWVYQYRDFIWRRAITDLRYQYAGTGLGFVWSILKPLIIIGIYSIVFGKLMSRQGASGIPTAYPIFLCSGLLPWQAFAECIQRGAGCFRANGAYLKKLPVPEEAFVAQTAVAALLNGAISFSLLVMLAALFGHVPTWRWLLLPIPLVLLQTIGFGLGLMLGTLNAFFPDISHFVEMMLRMGMWLCPVIFPMSFYAGIDSIPGLADLILLNPATAPLIIIRDLFVYDRLPSDTTMIVIAVWVVGSCLVGTFVLRKLQHEIRDVL